MTTAYFHQFFPKSPDKVKTHNYAKTLDIPAFWRNYYYFSPKNNNTKQPENQSKLASWRNYCFWGTVTQTPKYPEILVSQCFADNSLKADEAIAPAVINHVCLTLT